MPEVTELEHSSPRIGRVCFDPAKQPRGRPDVVALEILSQGRVGYFRKNLVRLMLKPVAAAPAPAGEPT